MSTDRDPREDAHPLDAPGGRPATGSSAPTATGIPSAPDPATPARTAPDGSAPAGTAPDAAPTGRRSARVVTVVLGAVLLTVAVVAAVAEAGDVHVDPWAVLITLMLGVGALLLAGAFTRRDP